MEGRIFKNIKINLVITLGIGILKFIINKYFAQYMGVYNLGLMNLFTQMISYLSLADLGLASASSYALYEPLERKDNNKINIIVSTIDSFYKKIAFAVFVLGVGVTFFIPSFIKNIENKEKLYVYWILYVINTSLSYIFAKYPILFTANQEYGIVRKIQGSGKILIQILQIIILIKTRSFILFILMMSIENIYNFYFYKKHYNKKYTYIKYTLKRNKYIVKDMKDLFWHKIGSVIVFNTDYIILSKFVSISIIGIYSSYLMVYQMILVLINIVNSVLKPEIGIFIVKNTKDKIYEYWRELYALYVMLGTIAVILTYKYIQIFIKLWLGNEFILSKLTVILILINLFIQFIRGSIDIFKESCGFFEDTYIPILESGLNFICSIILVNKMGLNGVILGTVLSNIVIIFLIRPILVFKRCFDKKWNIYIIENMKLIVLSILLGVIIFNLRIGVITKWKELISIFLQDSTISIIIGIIIFLLDKNFRKLIKRILMNNILKKYKL